MPGSPSEAVAALPRVGLDDALARLRESDTPVWVASSDGVPVDRSESRPARVALVLGNEAAGVSAPILAAADRVVAIPIREEVDSLNAAVAGTAGLSFLKLGGEEVQYQVKFEDNLEMDVLALTETLIDTPASVSLTTPRALASSTNG